MSFKGSFKSFRSLVQESLGKEVQTFSVWENELVQHGCCFINLYKFFQACVAIVLTLLHKSLNLHKKWSLEKSKGNMFLHWRTNSVNKSFVALYINTDSVIEKYTLQKSSAGSSFELTAHSAASCNCVHWDRPPEQSVLYAEVKKSCTFQGWVCMLTLQIEYKYHIFSLSIYLILGPLGAAYIRGRHLLEGGIYFKHQNGRKWNHVSIKTTRYFLNLVCETIN